MPTQLPPLRRSRRNAGKKNATPKFQHNLFKDPPKVVTNRKAANNNSKKQAITKEIATKQLSNHNDEEAYVPLDLDDSSDEEEKVLVNPKTHASKNYTKIELFKKWKKSAKRAAEQKGL